MRTLNPISLLFALLLPGTAIASPVSINACLPNEKWEDIESLGKNWNLILNRKLFKSGAAPELHYFAESLALRKSTDNRDHQVLAEYLMSRSLLGLGFNHIAFAGFKQIVFGNPPVPDTLNTQWAALQCMVYILQKYPALSLSSDIGEKLHVYSASLSTKSSIPNEEQRQEALAALVLHWAWSHPKYRLSLLPHLRGLEKNVIQGIQATHASSPAEVVKYLSEAMQTIDSKAITPGEYSSWINTQKDALRLLLARAYYSLKLYDRAIGQYQKIDSHSNILAESIWEKSWAQLQSGQHFNAFGSAQTFKQKVFRNVFAPEAYLIQAISMNELCQFPHALSALSTFKKDYQSSFQWLEKNSDQTLDTEKFYKLLTQRLKGKNEIPDRVATELLSSPVFLSAQEEINGSIDENNLSKTLISTGLSELSKDYTQILAKARALKPKVRLAQMKLKNQETLPKDMLEELEDLRILVLRANRLQRSGPLLSKIVDSIQKTSAFVQKQKRDDIFADGKFKIKKMKDQIEEVLENMQLVEIEIFQGASQDMVWQNANPDFKTVSRKIAKTDSKSPGESTWDWGTLSSLDSGEVWEDEIGAMTANLADNCANKERYANLRRKK